MFSITFTRRWVGWPRRSCWRRRWPSPCSARRRPRARRRRCRATSTLRAVRRARRPTAPPGRCSPPTTGRCTRSSAPRTAATSTSAWSRPAGSSTPRRRSRSAPARPAPSPSCTTRPPTATTCPSRRARPARAARGGNAGPGPNGADIGAPAMALPVTVGGQPAYGVLFDNFGTGYRDQQRQERAHRLAARGHLHADLVEPHQQSVLLRLRLGRDQRQRRRQRHHERDLLRHRLLDRQLHRPRPLGGRRPRERHVLQQHRQQPLDHTRARPARSSPPGRRTTARPTSPCKYGNGQSGGLTEAYSGALPNGYNPMKVQNSIELGTGGDNTGLGTGEFFEGAVVSGFPSDATENAVQANIVAAGYSHDARGRGRLRRHRRRRARHRAGRQLRHRRTGRGLQRQARSTAPATATAATGLTWRRPPTPPTRAAPARATTSAGPAAGSGSSTRSTRPAPAPTR